MTTDPNLTIPAVDILVVDDTIESLKLLIEILTRAGYHVRPADGPHVALESALAHPPGLILLDVRMPEMNGFEVCRRLKQDERTSDIPVIFVSALQDTEDRVQGFEVGGVDFISKPFQEPEVLARVKTHLQLREMQLNLETLVSERTAELTAANQALQESEAKHRTLVDNSLVGVFTTTLDGQFLFVNNAIARIYDFDSTEQILAKGSLARWRDPKRREKMLTELKEHGSVSNFEAKTITDTGRHIDVLFSAKLEGDGISGMVMDITERKNTELALQESEEKYRFLVEQAQDGIVVIQDSKIQFANPHTEKLFGYTSEELLNTVITEYVPPDELPKVTDIYRRRMKGESVPSVYESAILHKDGSRVEVEFNAGLTLYNDESADLVMIRDITEKKRTERMIKAQKELLENTLESLAHPFYVIDVNDYSIRMANSAARKLGAAGASTCHALTHQSDIPCDSADHTCPLIEVKKTGKSVALEHTHYDAAGKPSFVEIHGYPIFDGEGNLVQMIEYALDITARKQAEGALRQSEERFRATFEQAAVGIAHVATDGRFLRLNQRFCDIVGYTDEEMLERTFQDITHPNDLNADLEHVQQLLAGESESYSIEKRYLRKNGEVVWTNLTVSLVREEIGEPRWFVSVVEDITERKQAEEELRISEEKFYKVFQSSPASITISNLSTGEFIDVNPSFERDFGYSREEIIGASSLDINIWKNLADRDRLMPLYLEQGYLHEDELELIRKSGEPAIVDVHFSLIQIGDEDFSISAFTDITERKQAEQEIEVYQQKLKALATELTLSEERERRRIAADLHDEVGQTLAFARIQLATAREDMVESEVTAMLDDVSNTIRQAIRDTRDLVFDLSSPLLNELGLPAALAEWLEEQVARKHGLQTEFKLAGEKIVLDEDMRAILFRNTRELLTNVVKHAQAGKVSVRLARVGNEALVIVEDDGNGFDPLAAAETTGRKGGFGLFSIRERMLDLGGSLEIVSEPGQGCTAILTAPLGNNS